MQLKKSGLWLGLGIAVPLVMAGGLVWSQRSSSTDDLKTEKQVQAELQDDDELKDNNVDVKIDHGVATLTGTVDTKPERARAERIARVEGVTRVDDQLKVGRKKAVPDDIVTADIQAKYLRDDTLRHTEIAVTTMNGVVSLRGNVQSDDERRRAIQIARRCDGVKRVEDKLQIVEASPPPLGTVPR